LAHEDSFGGRAGDVVARAVSPAALVTGLVAGISVAAVVWICFKAGIEQVAPGLTSVVLAGFIARAAVERRDARWRGARGVPFADYAPVALQYLLLNIILLLPMLLVGWHPDLIRALISLREESGPALTLLLFYVLVIFIAPPLLLIVEVSARETTQIISPMHWSRCFSNRGTDVFLIYVLYVGSLFAVVALCLPLLVLLATFTAKTLLFTLPLTVVFAAGAAVLLLGGLCGEYARVAVDAPVVEPQAPKPAVVLPPPTSRKPPLLDAGKRVAETKHDIAALEALREEHAPNPAVLHALSFAYASEGRRDDAIAVAREGIPLAMRSGGVILAAEMFDRFRADADFGIQREQVVAFADALRNSKRLATSARLYVFAVESQPTDVRAAKGAIATAEVGAGALRLSARALRGLAADGVRPRAARTRGTGSLTRL
jgi:hypothetical protein